MDDCSSGDRITDSPVELNTQRQDFESPFQLTSIQASPTEFMTSTPASAPDSDAANSSSRVILYTLNQFEFLL